MKFKQFVHPLVPHDSDLLEQGEIESLADVFKATFLKWHNSNRDQTTAESFSFQLNEGTPTDKFPNPPDYLINLDLPGGRHYVIGHLWMSPAEIKKEAWYLAQVLPLGELYSSREEDALDDGDDQEVH